MIDKALVFLGDDTPKSEIAELNTEIKATSNSQQISIKATFGSQKLPNSPKDRPWPPKNRMHRKIT